jgi:hypothetical protein
MIALNRYKVALEFVKGWLKLKRRLRASRKFEVRKKKAAEAAAAPPQPTVDRKRLIAYHLGLSDAQFRRRYRLSKEAFLDLVSKVGVFFVVVRRHRVAPFHPWHHQ